MGIASAVRSLVRSWGYDFVRYAPQVERPFRVLPLLVEQRVRAGKRCFVVQVGANDGVSCDDPVRPLIQSYTLPALLVEPVPHLFARLVANYAGFVGVKFEQAAVADKDGEMPFYVVEAGPGLPERVESLGSFDRRHFDQFDIEGLQSRVKTIPVQSYTMASLFKKHDLAGIDLLQVDVEGFDDVVVKGTLDAGFRPAIINYESCIMPPARRAACRRLLADHGYQYLDVGLDTLAIRPTDLPAT